MRSIFFTSLALFLSAAALAADPGATPAPVAAPPGVPIDEETQKILDEINSLNAYEKPELELRKDEKYAHTPPYARPFRHVEPHKLHFLEQMEYTGAGRAIPEPDDVKSVKIGFIGPIEPTVSIATGGKSHEEKLGKKMLQGCQLAIEEANAQGGYHRRKIPFELVVDNDGQLWGASGDVIIKHAYVDNVWAILGSIDGANSHIAIRVALKAEVVMMNSGDTDPTFIETNIPWVFRAIGDDRQQAYLLVDYLFHTLKCQRVGIIRASNRYGRFGVRELRDGARRIGRPIPLEMAYRLGNDADMDLAVQRIAEAKVDAVVHWGNDADGAAILNRMRAAGMKQPFLACDRCASDEFVELAGPNAEGVICAFPWDPTRKDPKLEAFREAFRKKFNEEPETYATHGYDGMNMLIWAIQVAGLNRAKIRDVLAYRMKPWEGVTGDISFSAVMDDIGEVYLAKYEGGAWKYESRESLGLPPGVLASEVKSTSTAAPPNGR